MIWAQLSRGNAGAYGAELKIVVSGVDYRLNVHLRDVALLQDYRVLERLSHGFASVFHSAEPKCLVEALAVFLADEYPDVFPVVFQRDALIRRQRPCCAVAFFED